MDQVEQLLFHCEDCNVYKLPARQNAGGHRASEWQDNMIWTGICKVVSKGDTATVQLLESDGSLFAKCPVQSGPNAPKCMDIVADSSRYFVLRIEDSGKHAYIGIGFKDRDEAFDFKVALTDHKRQESQFTKPVYTGPKQDLSMKSGDKIVIALSGKVKAPEKTKKSGGGGFSLAPPPSGGSRSGIAPPPSAGSRVAPPAAQAAPASPKGFAPPPSQPRAQPSSDLFGQHSKPVAAPTAAPVQPKPAPAGNDLFGSATPFAASATPFAAQPPQPARNGQDLFSAPAKPAAAPQPSLDLFGTAPAAQQPVKRQDPNAGLFAQPQKAPATPAANNGDFLFAEAPKQRPSVEDLFSSAPKSSPPAGAGPPSLFSAPQQAPSPPPQQQQQPAGAGMNDLFGSAPAQAPQQSQPAKDGSFLDFGPSREQDKASVMALFGAPSQPRPQQPQQQRQPAAPWDPFA